MARAFEVEFLGRVESGIGPRSGFFHWVDGAPAEGYRAPRTANRSGEIDELGLAVRSGDQLQQAGVAPVSVSLSPRRNAPIAVLTGEYGARVLTPLIDDLGRDDVRVVPVPNRFFGGNVAVSGLMVGEDIARVLSDQPAGYRYLLPDVCLSGGLFLDGTSPSDLPHPVEIVATDGIALRMALGDSPRRSTPERSTSFTPKESHS